MRWVAWGVLLIITNVLNTLVSRARNTGDIGYHGVIAFMGHATWFISNVLLVGIAVEIKSFTELTAIFAVSFYTTCATLGSVLAHHVSLRYLEYGSRRVGAYHGEQR